MKTETPRLHGGTQLTSAGIDDPAQEKFHINFGSALVEFEQPQIGLLRQRTALNMTKDSHMAVTIQNQVSISRIPIKLKSQEVQNPHKGVYYHDRFLDFTGMKLKEGNNLSKDKAEIEVRVISGCLPNPETVLEVYPNSSEI
ncbi:hypothetical protein VNO77_27806 [Canavalia gladiata]|uniref:Uncharacterized protein n=1 Tax=Canavalia gladiata TaxID=3824 RepID=A0AAN9Q7D9_CANGL